MAPTRSPRPRPGPPECERAGGGVPCLVTLVLTVGLTGCSHGAGLAPPPAAATDSPPRVSGPQGPVSPQSSQATLATVEAEGRRAEFRRHVAALTALGETLSAGNSTRLLVDGPATFSAMFPEIEAARSRVLLESYIFEASPLGERVADLLLKKRAEGLEVRVIYDSLGAFDTPAAFFDRLRAGGVDVCEFNPIGALRPRDAPLDINHRDHRKVLVVDDRIGFTGGINISNVYASGSVRRRYTRADAAGWRDTHVRLEGPVVKELARGFQEIWERQSCAGSPFPKPGTTTPPPQQQQNDDRLVVPIHSYGDGDSSRFYRALLAAIREARLSIRITMAYFVPDPGLVAALQDAARRKVAVELVLPGKSDSRLVRRAGQARYDELLTAGVRIYERHDTFVHAKTAVIDGVWSTIGSSNLDWRSFLHNDEVNVVILGREFGAEMEGLFAEDRGHADEVPREAWRKRGISQRAEEAFAQLWQYWF